MNKGTKEATKGGDEYDMASKKARRYMRRRWFYVKRKFWKRIRKKYRLCPDG